MSIAPDAEQFDFIVIGAGSAGAAVAARRVNGCEQAPCISRAPLPHCS